MSAALVGLLVCVGAIAFLVLVMLGILREVAILRSEVAALRTIVAEDPPSPLVNESLPRRVLERLPDLRLGYPGRHVLLVLNDGCGSCHSVVDALREQSLTTASLPDAVTCVVRAQSGDAEIVQLARALTDRVVLDAGGKIWRDLHVHTAPTLFAVDTATGHVVETRTGGDAAWVTRQVTEDAETMTSSVL
jgi:hypothetical protein